MEQKLFIQKEHPTIVLVGPWFDPTRTFASCKNEEDAQRIVEEHNALVGIENVEQYKGLVEVALIKCEDLLDLHGIDEPPELTQALALFQKPTEQKE